jgi:hypothetical protein
MQEILLGPRRYRGPKFYLIIKQMLQRKKVQGLQLTHLIELLSNTPTAHKPIDSSAAQQKKGAESTLVNSR